MAEKFSVEDKTIKIDNLKPPKSNALDKEVMAHIKKAQHDPNKDKSKKTFGLTNVVKQQSNSKKSKTMSKKEV